MCAERILVFTTNATEMKRKIMLNLAASVCVADCLEIKGVQIDDSCQDRYGTQ